MDFLGIGPLELVFILIIALIVLGPNDMVKAGKTIGRTLRIIISSDTWRVVQDASREIRNLPNRMMREAALDDLQKQLPNQSTIKSQLGWMIWKRLEKRSRRHSEAVRAAVKAVCQTTVKVALRAALQAAISPPGRLPLPQSVNLSICRLRIPQPEQSSEGAGSWSEPYNSGAEAASDKPAEAEPPAEADLLPDTDQPAIEDQQPAVESPVQVEESPAADRAQPAGEEPHPDEMQPGSE